MSMLFLGGVIPPLLKSKLEKENKSLIQYAADKLQRSFIEGLSLNDVSCEVISAPFISSFPDKSTIRMVSGEKFEIDNQKVLTVSYNNLVLYRLYSKFREIYRELKYRPMVSNIIIYSIHSPLLMAAYKYKKRINPKVHICLIVPDLPEFMSESRNFIYLSLKKIDRLIINRTLNVVDSYVLLSEMMLEKLPIQPNKKWTCIEGIASNKQKENSEIKEKNFTFLYTGTLDRRYNILDLIEAFIELNEKNVYLWICGKGNTENEILELQEKHDNIKYWGQVPQEEVFSLQKRATVLVNPRKPEGEYTKYSFPSKTIEYLSSGTPVLMHRLPSIPKEYNKYLYFINDNEKGLYQALKKMLFTPSSELTQKGKSGASFIMKNKNAKIQVEKMLRIL